MKLRIARRVAAAFFVAYTVVLVYPGILPFNRIRPLVFGLPFSMAWVALWVALSILVLGALDYAERAAAAGGDAVRASGGDRPADGREEA